MMVCEPAVMTRVIQDAFGSLPGAIHVDVSDHQNAYDVKVYLSTFDREHRSAVYDAEARLYDQFPDVVFDVKAIDASTREHNRPLLQR